MLKLSGGKSDKDRISFYTSDNDVTAIRHSNGEITIEFGTENEPDISTLMIIFGIFATITLIKAGVLIPLIEAKTISIIWYFVPTFFYAILTIFPIIDLRKTGGRELLRNHGAEHKVWSAYKRLKRVPTVEEANRFSRINKDCGVTMFTALLTSQLIGVIVYLQTSFIIPEIILYLIPLFFRKIFPFNFIGKIAQFFTTSEPNSNNIELAIAALSALERREILGDILTDDFSNISKN